MTEQDVQQIINQLENYLSDLKNQWKTASITNNSWWYFTAGYVVNAFNFLLQCIDKTILFVEPLIPTGQDKKAVVMAIMDKLFDYTVVQACPLWLKPFIPAIKGIYLIICGETINYIVAKYNSGFWSTGNTGETTNVQTN
jgi:hypothetical protein